MSENEKPVDDSRLGSSHCSTLGEALPQEIKRCQDLVTIYRSVPNGEFGARMIENDIQLAIRAMAENDLPTMIYAYQQLKENKA